MFSKLKYFLSTANQKSQDEPIILVILTLFLLLFFGFLLLVVLLAVKLLGILFIPVVSLLGAISMVLIERFGEESE